MQSLVYLALSNAVLATLLAALAVVVARYCRRPAVRHALWLLVLLKLLTPPLVPLSVTWPRSEESEPSPPVILPSKFETSERIPPLLESALTSGATTVRERRAEPLPYGRGSDLTLVVVVWLGGALTWWSVATVRLLRFRRLLRQAQPATAHVQEQGRRLAVLLRLRCCPPIVFVSAPLSPMLWALGLSPRVLVPAELWRRLTAEQQDTLLAHELAHLRRGDHWVRRLEFLVLGLYWWHPVVWWARRRLQEAEEECCDALVVAVLPEAAPDYASALVETVAFLSQTRRVALVGTSGIGYVPLLKRRLAMILSETSARKPSRIGFWMVLGVGALLLPLAPEAARTEAPKEPQSVESAGKPMALDFGFPIVNPAARSADDVRNCVSCHAMPDPHRHALQHPWKGIHDQLVRLTEEYNRELRKTDRRPQPANDRSRAEEIENLQDDIELLKAQVQLKERRVEASENTLNEHRRRLRNYEAINKKQPGSIPTDTLMGVKLEITTHEGQLQINKVELQESLIRLKQAERRLARLQGPAQMSDSGDRVQQEKRLRDLEQKVEKLLKEIHKMREDMRPDKSRVPRKPVDKDEGQGKFTPRQKRQLRWSMRFNSENGDDYVAQLRGLGAILAIPVQARGEDFDYRIVRNLAPRSAKMLNEDIQQVQQEVQGMIRWMDNDPRNVTGVLKVLGLPVPNLPRDKLHFVACMPVKLEEKLLQLELDYLKKKHSSHTEDDIVETRFGINRSGSRFEPEVVSLKIR